MMTYNGKMVTDADLETGGIPKYGGTIYYVSKTKGNNSNDGLTPTTALETQGEAIGKLTAGDRINVMAGTYTEVNVNLNVANCKIHYELGAILDPATGTALTVSAGYCGITCEDGALKITPAKDQTGVLVTGEFCYLSEIRVNCFITDEANSADIGFDILGNGCDLRRCRVSSPDVAAFKIRGDKVKLETCCTGGGANGAAFNSIGFWVTNTADKFRIRDSSSQGHATASIQIDTGCTNGNIVNFDSGYGDGKWSDADNTTAGVDDLIFDNGLFKAITFTDATQAFDLFTITGTVEIEFINAHVDTLLNAEMGNCKFRVYGTDGTTDTNLTIATSCNSLPAGSFLGKTADASVALTVVSSAAPAVIENASYKDPKVSSIIVADNTGTTTIQFHSDDGVGNKDGKINFHCKFKPISADGWVLPA